MSDQQERDVLHAGAQLLTRFCVSLDDNRFEDLVRLFDDKGRLTRRGETLDGRQAILDDMSDRPPGRRTEHVLGNVLIEEASANEARVTAVMTVYRHDSGTPLDGPAPIEGPATIARCHADLVNAAEGWRIAHLHVATPRFVARNP